MSPLISQLMVANEDLLPPLIETWVDVKSDVITTQEINSKPDIQGPSLSWSVKKMLTAATCEFK